MQHGTIDRKAPRERIQLDATSWVDVVRGFAHDTERTMERLIREVRWTQNRVIRGGRKVDDPRLGGSIPWAEAERDPTFHFTRLILDARYRVRLFGPQLVYYRNGRDSMGLHRDDEMRYLDKTIIAGLAFGATRPFVLRAIRGGATHELMLASGDLYVMGGRCQADWLHGVPKMLHDVECGPKISAVWRWTAKLGRPVEPAPR
ncbi:alpha-ketoglutarate-dependent dioxygenase AlkB [Paraliomyxa miuraensis]|uniref:alpha-ketoglutarate-dependent dioxygenase AlkB n=1 Tax=Paraliomyxa miuraensis TaxID=376150 RepID=UPI00224CD3DD|nr:alpha-ketoglutarate-dependent dioxygenase AlkB [Paraliomyxa miuraensis]MCX4247197.1 alpha-ketoglutarate-dependent dioxygenase AlkB [Paraliomyxa miuraensis]